MGQHLLCFKEGRVTRLTRNFILALALLTFPTLASAQGVFVPSGGPAIQTSQIGLTPIHQSIPFALITVCPAGSSGIPCTPASVSIFSDQALTHALSNPFQADINGNYQFAVLPGSYTITVGINAGQGFSYQYTASLGNQQHGVGIPSNPCSAGQTYTNDSTGNYFTCNGTVWQLVTSGLTGSPGGVPIQAQFNSSGVFGGSPCANVSALSTGPLNLGCDTHSSGPNPIVDPGSSFGLRHANFQLFAPGTLTATCTGGTSTCTLTGSFASLQNGDWLDILGAGAAPTMSTPGAPSVSQVIAEQFTGTDFDSAFTTGSTTNCFKIVARDKGQGLTAASTETCTSTGNVNGSKTISNITAARSNNTITYTSSAHGLKVGCSANTCGMVIIQGLTGDASMNGIFRINSVPSTTTFTVVSGMDTRNGAATASTGTGTGNYFLADAVTLPTWTSVGGGVVQYGIYRGASSGTETLYGLSKVNVDNNTNNGLLNWDDFGATMEANLSAPYFWPTNPPGSAVADTLAAQICSGGGTASITLCGSNVVINSVSGVTAYMDHAPAIRAAYVQAAAVTAGGSGMLYLPAGIGANNTSALYTNTWLDLNGVGNGTCGISQATPIIASDTIKSTCTWRGDLTLSSGQLISTTGSIDVHIPISGRANPLFWAYEGTGSISGISIETGTGPQIGFFDTNSQSKAYFRYMNFFTAGGNDYLSIPFYAFADGGTNSFGWQCTDCGYSTAQTTYGATATPVVISKDSSEVDLNGVNGSGRGMFFACCTTGGILKLHFYENYDWQAQRTPIVSIGQNISLTAVYSQIKAIYQDSSITPMIGCFAGSSGAPCGPLSFEAYNIPSGGALLTGAPFPSVTVRLGFGNNYGDPSTINNIGQNFNITFDDGSAGYNDGSFSGAFLGGAGGQSPHYAYKNELMGVNQHKAILALPATAPTCPVSAGGSVPQPVTFNYSYIPVWQDGGEGTASLPCSATTSSGNQTVTVSWTAIPGVKGYNVIRCNPPTNCQTPGSNTNNPMQTTTSFVDTASFGNGHPQFASSGPINFGNGAMQAPKGFFNTVVIADQGSCTMTTGTCSAQSLSRTYTAAPNCFATWNGTGTLTGILKAPSTTTTVTPASSIGTDTAVVNWACFGN